MRAPKQSFRELGDSRLDGVDELVPLVVPFAGEPLGVSVLEVDEEHLSREGADQGLRRDQGKRFREPAVVLVDLFLDEGDVLIHRAQASKGRILQIGIPRQNTRTLPATVRSVILWMFS